MQLHATSTAQNTHLSTQPRFLRRAIAVALAAGVVAIAGLSLSGTLAASHDDDHRGCTLATLKGRYLFVDSGTALPPELGVTQPTPGATAGFELLNGDGTGTATLTVRIGTIALENLVIPFNYTVNADCTGNLIAGSLVFDLFIAPDGEQFASIATAPPGTWHGGLARRVSRR